MMKTLLVALMLLVPLTLQAKQAPPAPPDENPHPPKTAVDQKRVAFAEAEMNKWLIEAPDTAGLEAALAESVRRTSESLGAVTEKLHGHVVPRATPSTLAADEIAVHFYVRGSKRSYWHDLSVIISEGKNGLVVRRFIAEPMQSSHKMPPGTKC